MILAAPTALAMLPPAWTPALLRTPEFRQQTLYIGFLLLAVLFSPLIYRYLSDWWRGAMLVLLGAIPFQALIAYTSLLPALEKLYQQPFKPGAAYYLVAAGAILLGLGGVLIVIAQPRQRKR